MESNERKTPVALEVRRLSASKRLSRPSSAFAVQMRTQRDRKGWTQRQLAERLEELGFPVHQTTVGKWEAGERKISLDEAMAICVALDVAPSSMIAGAFLRSQSSRLQQVT